MAVVDMDTCTPMLTTCGVVDFYGRLAERSLCWSPCPLSAAPRPGLQASREGQIQRPRNLVSSPRDIRGAGDLDRFLRRTGGFRPGHRNLVGIQQGFRDVLRKISFPSVRIVSNNSASAPIQAERERDFAGRFMQNFQVSGVGTRCMNAPTAFSGVS